MTDQSPRNIVIVGGVAGGMSAAARMRRLDETANIIVLEKGEYVSFANCGLPYYVGGEIQHDWALLLHTPDTLKATLDLDVRINHEAVAIDTAAQTVAVATPDGEISLPYDELILAPGAKAVAPEIPGIDSPRLRTLRTVNDALDLRKMVEGEATRAVVLGGGFIGLEAAEALKIKGLEVAVVTRGAHVMSQLDGETANLVTLALQRNGVDVHTNVTATAIEHGADVDTVVLSDGTRLDADIIVLAIGVRPDTAFIEAAGIRAVHGAIVIDDHGRTSAEHVWAAGDAVVSTDAITGAEHPVPLAWPANRTGRLIADAIVDVQSARKIAKPLGTTIIRVFDQTVAMTGANRAALDRAGIAHKSLHLHPAHHAGYFPGAQQIHMLVLIDPASGRLLGAQAVGLEGVDKRIDVLATAIRAGMTVEDLIDLDLSYSPPYGQARDPINLVGLLGQNVMQGTIKLWFIEDLADALENALLLDVRSAREFAGGHLPGALNVPHTELRDRIDEVTAAAAGRPVMIYCYSGVRSYNAYRVAAQAGLNAATLSGGMLSLQAAAPDLVLEK
jgi:NADPH-dependent 2,4-dienoyl-CoA reductase/sulfur reductase-like enzyme/rhodanese-related sulfurtransferase